MNGDFLWMTSLCKKKHRFLNPGWCVFCPSHPCRKTANKSSSVCHGLQLHCFTFCVAPGVCLKWFLKHHYVEVGIDKLKYIFFAPFLSPTLSRHRPNLYCEHTKRSFKSRHEVHRDGPHFRGHWNSELAVRDRTCIRTCLCNSYCTRDKGWPLVSGLVRPLLPKHSS